MRKFRELFYPMLALALLSRVISDFYLGRWGIHHGEIFPDRHLPIVPIYSHNILILEWLLVALGGLMIVIRSSRKWGAALAVIGLCMSLSQLFQNHKLLLLICCICCLIELPVNKLAIRFFLKWQLVLVYFFSAISKIFNQFATGETLYLVMRDQGHLDFLHQSRPLFLSSSLQTPFLILSWLIIFIELGIPLLLIKRPNLGFITCLILHLNFSVLLPNIWPFSFIMIGLVSLFLEETQAV